MAIGNKVGSLKNLKRSLKQGGGGLIRYIPKNGEITVRFLEEPENWVNYSEHYDSTMKKSFPCIEDGCPGCKTDERKTSRYLANALDVEKDVVIAIQLPKNLTNSLVRKYERYDTIMDRDYTLMREGEGLDTEYDAEAEPVMKRKLTKYEVKDLQELLDQVYQGVFGDDEDDEDDEDEAPKRASKSAPRKRSAAAARLQAEEDEDEEEDDEEDEEEEEEPPRRRKSKFTPPPREEDEDEDEDEDEEDEEEEDEEDDDADEDEDDADFYTEDELTGMTLGQLRIIAKEYDIKTTGLKKADLIDALLGDDEE